MKRILFLALPLTLLFSMNCEGPEELEANASPDAAVESQTQLIRTHVGMEKAKASWLLPETSPNREISQQRWEALRMGTTPPLRIAERLELGMEISKQYCIPDEVCDVYDCTGWDQDGINADGVDENEHPALPLGNYGGGWQNCNPVNATYRCDRDAGGIWYTGTPGPGEPRAHTLQPGQHFWFTNVNYGGYCAQGFNMSPGQINDAGAIYGGNVFKNTITSFRWGGGCTSGPGSAVQLWENSGFPWWSYAVAYDGPNWHHDLPGPGINQVDDDIEALKFCTTGF